MKSAGLAGPHAPAGRALGDAAVAPVYVARDGGGQQPGPADDAPLLDLLSGLGLHVARHSLPAAKQPFQQKQGT